jgi:AraC-like DNA-binding protein
MPTAFDSGGFYKICPELLWKNISKIRKRRSFIEEITEELKSPQTDVCLLCINLRDLPSFCESNLLHPLNDVLSPKILKHYFPPVLDLCKNKGALYAIPEDFIPFVLTHPNEKNVRVPKTWQQLEKYSNPFSKKHKNPAIGVHARTTASILSFISALFASNGVQLKDFSDILHHKDGCFEAYRWIQKLAIDDELMDLRWLDIRFHDVVNQQRLWTYEFGWLMKKEPLSFWKKNDFSPFPLGPSHTTPSVLIRGHAWVIPANTKHLNVGLKSLRKIASLENILTMEREGGALLHAREDVWKNPTILKRFPAYQFVKARLPNDALYFSITASEPLKWLARSFFRSLVSGESPEQWFSRIPQTVTKDVHHLVDKAVSHMEKNLQAVSKIDQVCEHLRISRGYLDRLFRQHVQISASDYLKNLKMDYARKLLEESPLSIKEIAAKIGVSNRSVFSRAFHQHWGQSPTTIRARV